jgi:hypothetical protein
MTEMVGRGAADHALAGELAERPCRQRDLGVGQQVLVIYM